MERGNSIAESRTLSGLNFILGAWLIVSPYILSYASAAAKWDQTVFGIVVLILAAIRYGGYRAAWASWLNSLCGIWLIIAPWILNYSRSVAYWNEVIVGIAIAILAFWNVSTYMETRRHTALSRSTEL